MRREILPDFKGSVFEWWSISYINRNFWKFEKTIGGRDDAMSNAAMVYYDCRRRYGATVETRKHFMSLFKRCMFSEFLDWASWETRLLNTENTFARLQTDTTTTGFDGDLSLALQGASRELEDVLKLIFNAPKEILDIFRRDDRVDFFTKAVLGAGLPGTKSRELEVELRSLVTNKTIKQTRVSKESKPLKWFEKKGPILRKV